MRALQLIPGTRPRDHSPVALTLGRKWAGHSFLEPPDPIGREEMLKAYMHGTDRVGFVDRIEQKVEEVSSPWRAGRWRALAEAGPDGLYEQLAECLRAAAEEAFPLQPRVDEKYEE
eukprot:6639362-Lingulodinium_polyedra.AAC.1